MNIDSALHQAADETNKEFESVLCSKTCCSVSTAQSQNMFWLNAYHTHQNIKTAQTLIGSRGGQYSAHDLKYVKDRPLYLFSSNQLTRKMSEDVVNNLGGEVSKTFKFPPVQLLLRIGGFGVDFGDGGGGGGGGGGG
jgi:hypothetical protein